MSINQQSIATERVLSIDALRGFDMLCIIFLDRFFYTLHQGVDTTWTAALARQFEHPEWLGSTFYDIIMPLFLFVVGAVIPFSLSRRIQQSMGLGPVYRKLIRRFLILFFLGWIVQGNLLDLDHDRFHVFSNTLQAIAVGYFFTCMAYIHLSRKWLLVIFGACLVIYAIILTVPSVPGLGRSALLPDQSFALYVDHLVFGRFDDGTQYTWFLTGFGFTATVMSGLFAGELIRSGLTRQKIAMSLVIMGIVSLGLGLIWGIWHPVVKKLWSSSFVLASSGVCYLLLAMFYWIIDVKGWKRWAFPLKVIGMNAITAYVISHVVDFSRVADFFLYGLKQYTGGLYGAIATAGGFGLLYLMLWYMFRNRTFIKV